ncbi:Mis6-domain-containing protein [Diplocarpon rosae]|nr:Mis6-domain-containing protein [Diplocarpon rosae]
MASSHEPEDGLLELVTDLQREATKKAKQRAVKISSRIESVTSRAYSDGLSNATLDKLVDVITTPNELDQSSLGSLIRNLYPLNRVPDTIVVKVVASLGHGRAKPSYSVQAALLKWLIMVYDILANQKILSQLYSLFFNLLDTSALRMELIRQAGNEPPLVGLMRVYKDYYPDVIVGEVTSGRASIFTHPNPEWRQRLGEIHELHLQRTQDGLSAETRTFKVARKNPATGARSSVLPQVYTSHAQETSVTLEEIEDVHEFVQKLERIEPPNQLVAVINDPLLQKFLQLRSSDNNSRRIDSWLLAFFDDQLQTPETGERSVLEMLSAVLGYTRQVKILPTACLRYLKSMIPSWNGTTGREVILDIYISTLRPLEDALLEDGTTASQLALLSFYRQLMGQWMVFLLSHPQQNRALSVTAVTDLTNHASNLALNIIQTSTVVEALSTILDFYETTASLITHASLKSIARITIPPGGVVYCLLFTSSLNIVSRLCEILALYKRAFERAMASKMTNPSGSEQPSYHKDYVSHFNGFLMDVCNCLWRSRAFNTTDPNALGCMLPPTVTQALSKYISGLDPALSIPSLFSFSYSPLFSLFAISHVRQLEDDSEDRIGRRHAGPVTQSSLKQLEEDGGLRLTWPDYKLGVLTYMESQGIAGVGELMYNTMKHLMTARDKKGQA